MTDRLPRPLLAAVGAITQVRRVPSTLLSAPFMALGAIDRVRRSYDRLVLRGEQVVADRFGETKTAVGPLELAVPVEPEPHLTGTEAEQERVLDVVSHVPDPLDTAHAAHARPHQDPDEPLPDFDVMTLGALRGHVRALSLEQLQALLDYERTHQARPPVLHLVEHRLATLALS